jgi:hypothetical protein
MKFRQSCFAIFFVKNMKGHGKLGVKRNGDWGRWRRGRGSSLGNLPIGGFHLLNNFHVSHKSMYFSN